MATVERLENSRVKLEIEVSAEDFNKALADTFLKTRKKYNVPGFRKGKAPRAMIENLYGEGVFYEDAFDALYAKAYEKAIEENDIAPVDNPDISIDSIGKGKPLKFTATVDVQPEVTLGDYKGIEVVKRAYTVEDTEVDAIIEQEREKIARYIDQDRPIEDGDQVVLDYSGSIDGELFEGGTAQMQTLVIGSKAFIPGFEDKLIGMAKGEERDITLTFPEDYHAKELAAKQAVFNVVIHEIKVKELPELDDDFAQDVSEFDTLEALRADKRVELEKRNSERAKAEMNDEAVEKVVKNATLIVPESIIQRQMDYLMQELRYRLSMSGLSLEQYMQFTGMSLAKIREDYRASAEQRIRMKLVVDEIAKAEGIEASDEDIDKEIALYCEHNRQDAQEFKKTLGESDMEYFRERVRADLAIDYIMQHAIYIDAPIDEKGEKDEPAQAANADLTYEDAAQDEGLAGDDVLLQEVEEKE